MTAEVNRWRAAVLGVWGLAAIGLLLAITAASFGADTSLPAGAPGVLLALLVAIAVGVSLRVRLDDGREVAPVAAAFAMAAVTSPVATSTAQAAVVVLLVTGAGLVGVTLPKLTTRRSVSPTVLACHLVGALVAAGCFHLLPVIDGRTPCEFATAQGHTGWRYALVLGAVCLTGTVVDLLLTLVTTRPARAGVAVDAVLVVHAPVWSATVGTTLATVLGMRPLGAWSVLAMGAPLTLLWWALRRRSRARDARQEGLVALSRLSEVAGFVPRGHHERVSTLADLFAQRLLTSTAQRTALTEACLLHDLGQLGLLDPLPHGAVSEAAPADQADITARTVRIAQASHDVDEAVAIIEAAAVPYREVREDGRQVLLGGRILRAVNAYDEQCQGAPDAHDRAVERVWLGTGYEYDPDVVDLLGELTEQFHAQRGVRTPGARS